VKPLALKLLEPGRRPPAEAPLERVSGPAFPVTVKLLATAIMVALAVAGVAAVTDGPAGPALAFKDWAFLLAVVAVIGSGYWGIVTSRTQFDGVTIQQSWLWPKKVNLADISQVKLISIPGLGWLIVPRLVVRTGFGLTTFHAGDAAVLAQFRRLAHGG